MKQDGDSLGGRSDWLRKRIKISPTKTNTGFYEPHLKIILGIFLRTPNYKFWFFKYCYIFIPSSFTDTEILISIFWVPRFIKNPIVSSCTRWNLIRCHTDARFVLMVNELILLLLFENSEFDFLWVIFFKVIKII